MSTTIHEGDWLRFQTEDNPGLIIEGTVITKDDLRSVFLWVGERAGYPVAHVDGRPAPAITILGHRALDRVARAIAEADGNSQPGCVYVRLAEAAMQAVEA